MKHIDQQIAIARHVDGLRSPTIGPESFHSGMIPLEIMSEETHWNPLPDYLNDLNVMLEVEAIFEADTAAVLEIKYLTHLTDILTRDNAHDFANRGFYRATAAQRAEAFLKALNLWVE